MAINPAGGSTKRRATASPFVSMKSPTPAPRRSASRTTKPCTSSTASSPASERFEENTMSRLVGSLVALVLISTALAAPAPQPFKAGWHNPVDPDKDCKFIREKASLTIEMSGTDHDFYPLRERVNAPRLLRDIEGDFEMQVRVQIDCRPSLTSTVKDQPSLVAAGFLLIPPAPFTVTCIRLEYGLVRDGT